jgi:hypothetical protein
MVLFPPALLQQQLHQPFLHLRKILISSLDMAEVLAVVASAISIIELAVQLTKGVQQLGTLHRSIRDIPDELETTLRELESRSHILNHVEPLPDQGLDFLQASLENCRTAATSLEVVVQRAAQSLKRGSKLRLGAIGAKFRVVMKKKEIQELKMRIDSADKMLSLAMHCYQMYMPFAGVPKYELISL